MKKIITYILPLILAISLSGCYTQFQTLNNNDQYSGSNNYGYAPNSNESAYTEGYRTGWNDYSLYSFRDYNYTRYWADFYGGYYNSPYNWSPYYNPYIQPYGYMGFGYTWDPYFAFNFGYYNYGYSPYGFGYSPYGYYGGYYHHYYSYNYYEVPNSGNNIYRDNHPRSMGVQPVNRNTGSYGYNRPQRGSTYTPRSSGNSGNTTQGTYSRPSREPRSTGSVRSSGSSRPERAPRSSGRSAPPPSNNGGSRPDRGGNHQMMFSPGANVSTQSSTPRDNGRNYYRPQRANRQVQQNTTNNRNNNNFSFHSLIRPERSASQSSSNNSSVTRTRNSGNIYIGRRSAENYQRSERPSRNRNIYYYHPTQNYNRNSNFGYSRSYQSNNRSTYTAPHQTFQHFSSPRVDRAPRVDRSSNNSHSSSSGNRPRRH